MTPATEGDRGSGLRLLAEQMPRFMRLIHGLKAQHAAEGGRDRAAHVLLFPLGRVGPLRQSALADLVHADRSTVSRHVTSLVDQGLVRRTADESDGRASMLVITDAGRVQLGRLRAEREAYLRRVTEDWTDEELRTFTVLFDRLLDGIAATLPAEPLPSDLPPDPGLLPTDRTVTA